MNNNNGPRAKCDQVIYEAIAKACEIVVSSRGNSSSSNNTNSAASSSTRFNLHVPEIHGVRSILQNYRLALHVPIRLDVYYQHPEGGPRELLERWCLEYQPAPTERFLQAEGIVTQDPIVQLRHVCKRIVLWLRTLYCWSRLLPAQAFSSGSNAALPIGFSIYVNSQHGDDVSDLTQNKGFRWQNQPSPVVTPYGELGWKVFYSPSACVKRLLPQRPWITPSRPIPGQQQHDPLAVAQRQPVVPRTAPAYFSSESKQGPRRTNREHFQDPRTFALRATTMKPQQQHTYHAPSRLLFHRSQSAREEPSLSLPQNRQESVGSSSGEGIVHIQGVSKDDNDSSPSRVMSGLSLALMMHENEHHSSEKRHAALHEIPPHLAHQQQSTSSSDQQHAAPAAAEYGYAYNTHIPWQHIHPSSNPPVVGRSSSDVMDSSNHNNNNPNTGSASTVRYLDGSSHTSALGSTPPSGAFLASAAAAGRMTPPTGAFLMRPRSMTPPFQNRPAGFVHDAPPQQYHSLLRSTAGVQQHQPEAGTTSTPTAKVTSLDLLHSSPFQQPGSFLSSLSSSAFVHASSVGHHHSDLRQHSMWSATQISSAGPSSVLCAAGTEEDESEMPFAVDLGIAVPNLDSALSSSLYSSAAVASFAQKCAPTQNRLKLFDNDSNNRSSAVFLEGSTTTGGASVMPEENGDTVLVHSLADQLAEFHTFGASLQPSSGGSESAASTGTPISLRS